MADEATAPPTDQSVHETDGHDEQHERQSVSTEAVALLLFGAPRTTQDIDIVIEPTLGTLERLLHSLPDSEYYVSREAAREAYGAKGMFNLVDFATGWKVDFIIRKRRSFSQEEFRRRQPVETLGMRLLVASAEDVIVPKLEWAKLGESERQLRDVAGILRGQGDALDVGYVERWVTDMQLGPQQRRICGQSRLHSWSECTGRGARGFEQRWPPRQVVSSYDESVVSVPLNKGNGSFGPKMDITLACSAIALADMNHDGNLDLITSCYAVTVRLGNGKGSFGAPIDYNANVGELSAVVDFDGDGNLDIVAGDGSVGLVFGAGDGTFTRTVTYRPQNVGSVAVGDLNHDGLLDVVATHNNENAVSVMLSSCR